MWKMSEITIDDLKTLHRVYEKIEERGYELVAMISELEKYPLFCNEIYEVLEDKIGFLCENKWNECERVYFKFDDFISDDYFNNLKKQVAEKQEKERLESELQEKEKRRIEEEKEYELYLKLKSKYDGKSDKYK